MQPPSFRIVLSKRAANDLDSLFAFIARDSPQNAPAMVERILSSIENLKLFPHRSVLPNQSSRVKHVVRSLPVQSYIIFFRVLDDEKIVRILRVRHAAMRRPKRFPR